METFYFPGTIHPFFTRDFFFVSFVWIPRTYQFSKKICLTALHVTIKVNPIIFPSVVLRWKNNFLLFYLNLRYTYTFLFRVLLSAAAFYTLLYTLTVCILLLLRVGRACGWASGMSAVRVVTLLRCHHHPWPPPKAELVHQGPLSLPLSRNHLQ